jgi:hypothetical protein
MVTVLLSCAAPQSASAVIVYNTTQNTSPGGFPISQLNNFGSHTIGGAVYLGQNAGGQHWAITASHLGVGSVTIGGNTYLPVAGSDVQLTNAGIGDLEGPTDLTMFRLQSGPALANLNIATLATHSDAALMASPVYVIGNGRNVIDADANQVPDERDFNASFQDITPNASPAFEGFRHQSPANFTIRWGTNFLEQVALDIDVAGLDLRAMISNFTDPDEAGGTSFESQVTFGDSGGAVFDAGGVLLGLIHAQGTEPGQPSNINLYGNESAFSDLRYYQPQIAQISQIFNTPEPAALVLAALAVLGTFVLLR